MRVRISPDPPDSGIVQQYRPQCWYRSRREGSLLYVAPQRASLNPLEIGDFFVVDKYLSLKYSELMSTEYILVTVDRCKPCDSAKSYLNSLGIVYKINKVGKDASYGATAMPTFIKFEDALEVGRVSGFNMKEIKALVQI